MIASLGRLWAVASMTLLEASRRKVFSILILFAVALLSSLAFFPAVDMEGRLRLMEAWSLRAASLFATIVALFVSGFSLPGDFETKRIYLLVSKPISKVSVFLGRFLGFALLLALFLAIMGAVTLGFIAGVKFLERPAFPPLVAYPRVASSEFIHVGGEESPRTDSPNFVIGHGEDRKLIWRFSGLRRSDFPERIRAEARMVMGSPADIYRNSGDAVISVVNRKKRQFHEQRVFVMTNQEQGFNFPSTLIGDDGTLEVSVACGDADGAISAGPAGVVLYGKSDNFAVNFGRGLLLVFFQSVVILSLTLTASTFLSAPISVLLGIVLYVVGSMHSYTLEGVRDIDRSLAEIRTKRQEGHQHPGRTPEDLPEWVLRWSTFESKVVLSVAPDFAEFDFSRWLLKDLAVSWREVGRSFGYALWRWLALVALGMLLMRFKDFG